MRKSSVASYSGILSFCVVPITVQYPFANLYKWYQTDYGSIRQQFPLTAYITQLLYILE